MSNVTSPPPPQHEDRVVTLPSHFSSVIFHDSFNPGGKERLVS